MFSIGIAAGEPAGGYVARNDAALKRRAASKIPVFYAFGKDDFLYALSVPTRKIMDDYKIAYTYREGGGGHTWVNWRLSQRIRADAVSLTAGLRPAQTSRRSAPASAPLLNKRDAGDPHSMGTRDGAISSAPSSRSSPWRCAVSRIAACYIAMRFGL